jgi:betaine-aldehyde dehydrogenase/aminobutyraldehyde dehydrogenase
MVSLTGSVRTGKAIAAAASEHLARVHLGSEARPRIIATPRVHDAVVQALVPAASSLTIGEPPLSDDVELGPVISAAQREKVLGFVERAGAPGAEVACGGGTWGSRGFFVEPTVIVGPAQDSEIVQREVFGPVITVHRAADEAQALEWVNDTDYGRARPSGRATPARHCARRGS